ncbi:DMT family transporter [Marinilongibacter aquaticus]|uniref:DMT family transporter n=1 Tax=Marinilongibacter aquaticus TaxID=2975157 RepID=UPI0021BD12E9|nr:DMT family transporter [Marinilongibacter aquaticus]UBM58037.1 DMT family transporter [Marinilongibacter aquaticus]
MIAISKKSSLLAHPFLPWGILLFLSLIWGLSFLFIKKIVIVLNPLELGAARVFVAGLFLLPWAVKSFRNMPKEKLKYVAMSGFLGNMAPAFIYAWVGSKLNSGLAGTLNATTPIFVMLIGLAFFATKITSKQILGILFGFLGSLLLVVSGNDGEINYANPFALLAMVATFMYGINVNIINHFLKDVNPLALTSVAFLIVGFLSFWVLPFTDFFQTILDPTHRDTLVYLLILTGVNTAMALVVFNYLIQMTSAVFASSVTYMMPVVAMFAGFMDGEVVSFNHLLGIAIILLGVYLINRKQKVSR